MPRPIIAEVDLTKLKTVASGVLEELQTLKYPDKAVGNTKNGYYIVGRKWIKEFVKAMELQIQECEKYFTDPESAAEFESDRVYLKTLLEVK